ncbi:hypothetical protein PD5205_03538 [Xanthomonas fragariae]|uniref:Uncharacterized protein n=1 Tax=Xanthomonas fragariae TaxID=48664 RepID=A0A1Y6HTM9_9XANT|nr:hypothetical protein [Xanthomonas fragariae]SMQ93904.1 hypothetical protein NBC2815_00541 [Xanthomonas fragariae]SMQ97726.1 hypothetical protein PD885_00457 [Xanthomonas fragariae]SMR04813.1 hypothetical protein PD5205_03538 [Xanthomonas fragariae]
MNEQTACVRLHVVGGPQDGQMLCASSPPQLAIPEGYQIAPWPGEQAGIHWHHELNLACAHESLSTCAVYAALGACWRCFLIMRRQEAAARVGQCVTSDRHKVAVV